MPPVLRKRTNRMTRHQGDGGVAAADAKRKQKQRRTDGGPCHSKTSARLSLGAEAPLASTASSIRHQHPQDEEEEEEEASSVACAGGGSPRPTTPMANASNNDLTTRLLWTLAPDQEQREDRGHGEQHNNKNNNQEEDNDSSPASPSNLTRPPLPADQNVYLGRGKGAYLSQGNIRLQKLVMAFLPAYMKATRNKEKILITNAIVGRIKMSGGRFLNKTPTAKLPPQEVADAKARIKVAQALRYQWRQLKKEKDDDHEGEQEEEEEERQQQRQMKKSRRSKRRRQRHHHEEECCRGGRQPQSYGGGAGSNSSAADGDHQDKKYGVAAGRTSTLSFQQEGGDLLHSSLLLLSSASAPSSRRNKLNAGQYWPAPVSAPKISATSTQQPDHRVFAFPSEEETTTRGEEEEAAPPPAAYAGPRNPTQPTPHHSGGVPRNPEFLNVRFACSGGVDTNKVHDNSSHFDDRNYFQSSASSIERV